MTLIPAESLRRELSISHVPALFFFKNGQIVWKREGYLEHDQVGLVFGQRGGARPGE